LEASRIELDRGGVSYTADTLATLREEDPSRELFLILGSDAAAGLPTWERVDEVRKLATVVVATRPGAEEGNPPAGWRWERVETPRLEVSSTDLRARVADGRPLDYLLTPAVIDCIKAHGLYRSDSR
jgi:nicotinate-nucleotide adenylyltransferase